MNKYWIVGKDKKFKLSDERIPSEEELYLYDEKSNIITSLKYTVLQDFNGKIKPFGKAINPEDAVILNLEELRKKPLFEDFDEDKDILWFASGYEDSLPDPYMVKLPPIVKVTCAQIVKYPNGYMLPKEEHQKKRNIIREIWAMVDGKSTTVDLTVNRANELLSYFNYTFEDLLLYDYLHSDDWAFDINQNKVPIFTRAVLNLFAQTETDYKKHNKDVNVKTILREIMSNVSKGREITSTKADQLLEVVGKSVFDVFKPALNV